MTIKLILKTNGIYAGEVWIKDCIDAYDAQQQRTTRTEELEAEGFTVEWSEA